MTQESSTQARVALPGELAQFLIEFSIALQRHGMYPPGHPALLRSGAGIATQLALLLDARATLSLGVARHQLVLDGVATDRANPVLRALAERLHGHLVGAVVFQRGVEPLELTELLRFLSAEPQPVDAAAADAQRALPGWAHLQLYPLTYDHLELVGEGDGDKPGAGTRAEQLWLGLARAALAAEAAAQEPAAAQPAEIAQAIDEHAGAQAYDQVIVGYLLQIAQQLKGDAGELAVRRRISQMVGELQPGTLQRLLEMGGDAQQREQFVLDSVDAFAPEAVVELVKAAATTSSQTISDSMVRMLGKLGLYAAQGGESVQVQAGAALRDQVRQLISGWTLEDPNPAAYTAALAGLARHREAPATRPTAAQLPEPLRLVQMGLEVEATGPAFWRAADALLERGDVAQLLELLARTPRPNAASEALWQRVSTPEVLRALLGREPLDLASLDTLAGRLGLGAAEPLLDTLATSSARSARMAVFKRLSSLGSALAPLVTERLRPQAETRWFVVRNLLALLDEVGAVADALPLEPYLSHSDARVRRAAVRLALKAVEARERTICLALADADEQTAWLGAAAAQGGCPAAAVPVIATRLAGKGLSTDLRVLLVRLLEQVRSPLAVDALLRVATRGKTLLGRPKLAGPTPETLVALTALRAHRADARAAEVLLRARRSRDPAIRNAVAGGAGA